MTKVNFIFIIQVKLISEQITHTLSMRIENTSPLMCVDNTDPSIYCDDDTYPSICVDKGYIHQCIVLTQ